MIKYGIYMCEISKSYGSHRAVEPNEIEKECCFVTCIIGCIRIGSPQKDQHHDYFHHHLGPLLLVWMINEWLERILQNVFYLVVKFSQSTWPMYAARIDHPNVYWGNLTTR